MPILTPIKAIRKKCLDCCYDSSTEVKKCELKTCPLWHYRTGHRPRTDESDSNSGDKNTG